jgi:hypothetical protein
MGCGPRSLKLTPTASRPQGQFNPEFGVCQLLRQWVFPNWVCVLDSAAWVGELLGLKCQS